MLTGEVKLDLWEVIAICDGPNQPVSADIADSAENYCTRWTVLTSLVVVSSLCIGTSINVRQFTNKLLFWMMDDKYLFRKESP